MLKQGVLLTNTGISIANDFIKKDGVKHKILRKHPKIARAENLYAMIIKNTLMIDDAFFTAGKLVAISKQNTTNRGN